MVLRFSTQELLLERNLLPSSLWTVVYKIGFLSTQLGLSFAPYQPLRAAVGGTGDKDALTCLDLIYVNLEQGLWNGQVDINIEGGYFEDKEGHFRLAAHRDDGDTGIKFVNADIASVAFGAEVMTYLRHWTENSANLLDENGFSSKEKDIYHLFGYGQLLSGLTLDFLWKEYQDLTSLQQQSIVNQLGAFWNSWSRGSFLNSPFFSLPDQKVRLLNKRKSTVLADCPSVGSATVDISTSLNVACLLLKLGHREFLETEVNPYLSPQMTGYCRFFAPELLDQFVTPIAASVSGNVGYFKTPN